MSYEAVSWARKQHPIDPDTGRPAPVAKNVLCALAERHNGKNGQCYPRIEKICSDTDYGDTAVRKAIDVLEEIGLIIVERHHKAGNRYQLCGPLIRRDVMDKETPLSITSEELSVTSEDFYPSPRGAPIEQEEEEQERTGRALRAARAKKRATRTTLPDDFVPDLNYAMAKAGITEAEAREQAEQFRNHHLGKGNLMASWPWAWRTWCGNIIQFSRSSKPRNNGPPTQPGNPLRKAFSNMRTKKNGSDPAQRLLPDPGKRR